jgi:hypothetical protein
VGGWSDAMHYRIYFLERTVFRHHRWQSIRDRDPPIRGGDAGVLALFDARIAHPVTNTRRGDSESCSESRIANPTLFRP